MSRPAPAASALVEHPVQSSIQRLERAAPRVEQVERVHCIARDDAGDAAVVEEDVTAHPEHPRGEADLGVGELRQRTALAVEVPAAAPIGAEVELAVRGESRWSITFSSCGLPAMICGSAGSPSSSLAVHSSVPSHGMRGWSHASQTSRPLAGSRRWRHVEVEPLAAITRGSADPSAGFGWTSPSAHLPLPCAARERRRGAEPSGVTVPSAYRSACGSAGGTGAIGGCFRAGDVEPVEASVRELGEEDGVAVVPDRTAAVLGRPASRASIPAGVTSAVGAALGGPRRMTTRPPSPGRDSAERTRAPATPTAAKTANLPAPCHDIVGEPIAPGQVP